MFYMPEPTITIVQYRLNKKQQFCRISFLYVKHISRFDIVSVLDSNWFGYQLRSNVLLDHDYTLIESEYLSVYNFILGTISKIEMSRVFEM